MGSAAPAPRDFIPSQPPSTQVLAPPLYAQAPEKWKRL